VLHKYVDMHVHTRHSIGAESVEEIVRFAKDLELDTVCLMVHAKTREDLKKLRDDVSGANPDINILIGAEVVADNVQVLRNAIASLRPEADIIAVHGGILKINRAAVEDPRVDLLTHPERNRKDPGMDHVMARLAADNKVAIELNFRSFLHSYRKIRSHILTHMRTNVGLCRKYGAPVVISSGAETIWDLRSGRELSSIGHLCGMTVREAIEAVSDVPLALIEHAKQVKDKKFVMPGVEVVENG